MKKNTWQLTTVREPLPDTIHGVLTMRPDGSYIIIVNSNDTPARQAQAYLHECLHLWRNDLSGPGNIGGVETRTHTEQKQLLREMLELMENDDT